MYTENYKFFNQTAIQKLTAMIANKDISTMPQTSLTSGRNLIPNSIKQNPLLSAEGSPHESDTDACNLKSEDSTSERRPI